MEFHFETSNPLHIHDLRLKKVRMGFEELGFMAFPMEEVAKLYPDGHHTPILRWCDSVRNTWYGKSRVSANLEVLERTLELTREEPMGEGALGDSAK